MPGPFPQPPDYLSAVAGPGPLGTYQTLHVEVTLANTGTADIASLFWVDLYTDVKWDVPLEQQASVDWVAVNGLAAGLRHHLHHVGERRVPDHRSPHPAGRGRHMESGRRERRNR